MDLDTGYNNIFHYLFLFSGALLQVVENAENVILRRCFSRFDVFFYLRKGPFRKQEYPNRKLQPFH